MLIKILMKFLILSLITLQTSFGASTYVLPAFSSVTTVNEFGVCKGLTNSTSTSYMIPAGTSADWANFLLHLPAGINAVACVASDCSGAWGTCSVSCGGGSQTYNILTPATNGGAACTNSNGATQACNTQSCCTFIDLGATRTPSNCYTISPNAAMWPGCTTDLMCDNDFSYCSMDSCTGAVSCSHIYTYAQYCGCY